MSPRPAQSAGAVTGAEFAALMAPFAPFEPRPHVAAAVSGGADSMALVLLLSRWARSRGGAVTALTVDHGLRPESAAETAQVGRTLRELGLRHRILHWRGDKPGANIQAAARRARYALLRAWCARHGVLHLVLGHQLEDQAETLLLRLGRGSGLEGLAAMAALVEHPALRLLRPLLALPRQRLEATVRRSGLDWIEDPSNRDAAHARVRMRHLLPALDTEGLSARRLGETAARLGRARVALERAVAAVLARSVALHTAGFIWLDPAPLRAAPVEVGLRALARIAMTVGGLEYPPRLARLHRLYGRLVDGQLTGATLGGCRFLPRAGRVLVVREPAAVAERAVTAGQRLHWDGRFAVAVGGRTRPRRGKLVLSALGAAGWAELRAAARAPTTAIPAPALPALPALRDGLGVLSVPHLGYECTGGRRLTMPLCRFSPRLSLTVGAFTVA